jgi:hypothetical protein
LRNEATLSRERFDERFGWAGKRNEFIIGAKKRRAPRSKRKGKTSGTMVFDRPY